MTGSNTRDNGPSPDVWSSAAATFGLLASPMRLHIVWALSQSESDVSQLAQRVGGTPQAVSQHLAKLKLAGLVHARQQGRHRVYNVGDPSVTAAAELMIGRLSSDPPARGATTGVVA